MNNPTTAMKTDWSQFILEYDFFKESWYKNDIPSALNILSLLGNISRVRANRDGFALQINVNEAVTLELQFYPDLLGKYECGYDIIFNDELILEQVQYISQDDLLPYNISLLGLLRDIKEHLNQIQIKSTKLLGAIENVITECTASPYKLQELVLDIDRDFNHLTTEIQEQFKQDFADLVGYDVSELSEVTFKEQEGTGKTRVTILY